MIFTKEHIGKPTELTADLCVVGSGAGGAPVAAAAVAAGKRVLLLEAGRFWRPKDFSQLEHEMFPRLYHDKGGRVTDDQAVHIHQGKGLGGSTLHNINLCERIPDLLLEQWQQAGAGPTLAKQKMEQLYAPTEQAISVTRMDANDLNGNNRVFKKGVDALKYSGSFLKHNRKGCVASGFCELGCPFDGKQNALKVFIAPAVRKGLQVLTDTWAVRVERSGRTIKRLHAWVRDPDSGKKLQPVTINARAFCISASATGTPALLLRSEVPDPHKLVGSRLHIHPASVVAGIFDEKLESWRGRPQSYQCTEFLDFRNGTQKRVWLVPAFAHPVGTSSILSGFGAEHQKYMKHFPQMAAITAMIHDETAGRVEPKDEFGVSLEYWPDRADREQLVLGIVESARILFAGGAKRVVVPMVEMIELTSPKQVDQLKSQIKIDRYRINITAVHPMGSVWMGSDSSKSCVNPDGRYHHLDNLFVSDTSLFPTSIGVPPQLSTYALGRHVGARIVDFL